MSQADHCHSSSCGDKKKFDYLLWLSLLCISVGYFFHLSGFLKSISFVHQFSHSVFGLMNKMALGLILAIVFVGLLGRVPRSVITKILGRKKGFSGLIRATLAGLTLDLCNHGILVVGMKLYERGASLGQTMAFLIASPWNSFSMTIILVSLIGLKLTLVFILLSGILAITSGLIFDGLVQRKILPENANRENLDDEKQITFKEFVSSLNLKSIKSILQILKEGLVESRMILRWVFFGVVLAAVIRILLSPEAFQDYFGPSLVGLGLTLVAATVIEVCSEGSSPIAADLVNIGKAPGNSFTFLMAGASTDYTEIMALKETTKSWKISLFLPLITVPQILILGWLLNQ